MRDDTYWATKNELRFLEGLGTFSTVETSRKELLRRYKKTMHLKSNWGTVNSEKIKRYLESEITGERS